MAATKQDVINAEAEQARLEEALRAEAGALAQAEDRAQRLRTERSRLQGESNTARTRRTAACEARDAIRAELESASQERVQLDEELARLQAEKRDEDGIFAAVKEARSGLDAVSEALRGVKEEIAALMVFLTNTEAREAAALDNEGADLPVELVPLSVPEVVVESGKDFRSVWMETKDDDSGGKRMPQELQMVLQSQAVMTALQRSLCVRAAELREGLRQWGFARGATSRTQDMANNFEVTQAERKIEISAHTVDRTSIEQQHRDEQAALARARAEHECLRSAHAALVEELRNLRAGLEALQERRERRLLDIVEGQRSHDALSHAVSEASRSLEEKTTELERHPLEAASRVEAAGKLALRSEDQLSRGVAGLCQTQQELSSFREASAALQVAYEQLQRDLDAQLEAHANLKEEYENVGHDLHALAKYYIALVPELPGLTLPELGQEFAHQKEAAVSLLPKSPMSPGEGLVAELAALGIVIEPLAAS